MYISFPVSKAQNLNEALNQDQEFISNISVLILAFIWTCVHLLIVIVSVGILDWYHYDN